MVVDCLEALGAMIDRPSGEDVDALKARNRYAREVIAGNEVQLSHRPSSAVHSQASAPRVISRSLPSPGSPARTGYLLAIVAILLASVVLYLLLDFESASIGLFVLSLVLMAGWFVFTTAPPKSAQ